MYQVLANGGIQDHLPKSADHEKEAEALGRKLVAEPGPKPAPLRWLQLTVDGILGFIDCNEVDSPDQEVRLEQLRLADEPGSEDRLHLNVVGDRGGDVLPVLRVPLQSTRNTC